MKDLRTVGLGKQGCEGGRGEGQREDRAAAAAAAGDGADQEAKEDVLGSSFPTSHLSPQKPLPVLPPPPPHPGNLLALPAALPAPEVSASHFHSVSSH